MWVALFPRTGPARKRRGFPRKVVATKPHVTGFLILFGGILSAQSVAEFHRRADAGLQSFLLKYWSRSSAYLRANYPDDGGVTGYWTFAQGFDALLDGVERTGGQRYAGLIETFYAAQAARGWFVDYYDDECWMAVALTRAYDLTADDRYLETAEELYADIMGAWDETCCGTARGGLWWNRAHTQKATAANAGAVIAGARLFERTGRADYLEFARRAYEFWYTHMVDTATHHVYDHIDPDGDAVDWKFTYNEGLMIGAAVELHRQTGQARYLAEAQGFAEFLVSDETASSTYGRVLSDGTNEGCGGDCHAFKGPAYRYLTRLYEAAGVAAYRAVLKASVNAIWNLARNPDDDLFSVDWRGPPMTSYSEPQNAAAVMALNLYPPLEGPYPGTGAPSTQYEAEDATIAGVSLEARYGDFTGWGYVAAWNGDGRQLTFTVRVPVSGPYVLTFRYAAEAGDAVRVLRIDGVAVNSRLRFPGTAEWAAYATVAIQRFLGAGTHRIALIFDAGAGSANYLNLDHLRVEPLAPFFVRGDANASNSIDIADAVFVLSHLFAHGPTPSCADAGDANDDGQIDIGDAVKTLAHLFGAAGPLPAPFGACGIDPTEDELDCAEYAHCR